jgi:formyl-CoA transferase
MAGVLLDSHWKRLARLIGRPETADDPRYASALERIRRRDEVDAWVAAWSAPQSVDSALGALVAAGIPASPVRSYAEASRTPHVAAREMLQTVAHPGAGSVPLVGPAAKLSRTPLRVRTAAPELGRDGEQILAELGVDAAEQRALREAGVVR